MPTTIIYVLVDPRKRDKYRYVGKTTKRPERRLQGHIYDAMRLKKHTHKLHWIHKLLNENIEPELLPIESVDSANANDREIYWIEKLKKEGHRLTNSTLGGDGVEFTPEVRRKMSEARSGEKHPNWGKRGEGTPMYGKTHSNELKQKMRDKWSGKGNPKYGKGNEIRGENNPFYGKNHTNKTKEKIRERRKGSPPAFQGKQHTEETKERLRKVAKERMALRPNPMQGKKHSEETKRKMSEGNKGRSYKHSPEAKQKISEAKKAYWARKRQKALTKPMVSDKVIV